MQSEQRTSHPDAHAGGSGNGEPPRGNGDARRPSHGGGGDEHAVQMDLPEVSRGGVALIAVVVVVLFGALFLLGWIPHSRKQARAESEAVEAMGSKPVVDVARVKRSNPTLDLTLPADVQAFQSTDLFARTNGYLKPLPEGIDIGAEVKAGQLLAEIAAPEVDAELEQARAALQQANVVVGRANNEFNFAKGTFDRYSGLAQTGGVTQQQLDEKRSAFNIANSSLKAAVATVAAAEANVKRLTETQGFQRIVAPFDGTITARGYDSGALIAAANNAAGRELFRLAQTDRLRVFVNVPQSYATQVKPGQDAELLVRNYPATPFKGKVARSAGAIDPGTRTLRVEVEIPNAERRLFPGMYGQVRFKVTQEQPPVVVPTSALVFGPAGMRVAVVEPGDKVRFQKVVVGRDFGAEAEVATGLTGEERVVTNPGDRLADGVEVTVTQKGAPPKPAAAQAAAR